MRPYTKKFFLFLVAFSMMFNVQFYTANAAIEANATLTSGGETRPVIVYQNNSTELSDLLGNLMADTVEVKKVGDRYEVEVSFPQGQDVQEFALSGAKIEQKITDAESETKVYTVTVDDLTEIQDATITLADGTTQTVQLQFEGKQNPFGDIQGLANYSKIVSLFSRGVFKESDQFYPNSPTTRYQFALMLYRALDIEVDLSQAKNFKDLNNLDTETVDAIKALNAFGVINGISEDRFSPHATITRSQAARMIYRVLEKLGYTADDKTEMVFSDISNADEELLKATAALNKLGIMTGYQGEFSPDTPLTRDQMSKVLYSSLEVEEVAAVAVTGKTTSSISDKDSETPSTATYATETPSIVIPSVVTPSIVIPSVVTPSTATYATETPNEEKLAIIDTQTVKIQNFKAENVIAYEDNKGVEIPLNMVFADGSKTDLSQVPLTIRFGNNNNTIMERSKDGKTYTLPFKGKVLKMTVTQDNNLFFTEDDGPVPVGYTFNGIYIGVPGENMANNKDALQSINFKVIDVESNDKNTVSDENVKIQNFKAENVIAYEDNKGVEIPLNMVFADGSKTDLSQVPLIIKFNQSNNTAMTRSQDGKSYTLPFESIKWKMTVTEDNNLLFTVNDGSVPIGYKFLTLHIGVPSGNMVTNNYTEQVITLEVKNSVNKDTASNEIIKIKKFRTENVTGYRDNKGVEIPLNVMFDTTSTNDLSQVPLTIRFGSNVMTRNKDGKSYTLPFDGKVLKMTVTMDNNLFFTVDDGPVPVDYEFSNIQIGIDALNMLNGQGEVQKFSFKILDQDKPTSKDTQVKDSIKINPEDSKKKLAILVVAGQSNAVGYDESPVDPNDPLYQEHERIKQLGLRGDDNMKIIPMTYSAQNFQDMSSDSHPDNKNKLGTKGIHLPLGHLLLDYIPEDYELVIIPAAFGGTGFTTTVPYGDYDEVNKRPDNLVTGLRWGVESAYYKTIKDRISYLLDLNEDNYYIGTVWCQGENDGANPMSQWQGFEDMTDDFFDYFNEKYPNRVGGGKEWSKDQWFTYFTVPYWYSVDKNASGVVLIWMNYAYWSPSSIVPIFFTAGSEKYTNETNGTGKTSRTKASHYGNNAFADHVAPAVIKAMEDAGVITKEKK